MLLEADDLTTGIESGIGGYRFTTVWREEKSFAWNQQLQWQAVDQ